MSSPDRLPPSTVISREHPLIILQTSPHFDDPSAQGREAGRVWRETIPDALRPLVQLQVEIRLRDHAVRYRAFQRLLDEAQRAGVPVCLQICDPHDIYHFDPEYVEKLLQEFPCIRSLNLTESKLEHYATFNVPRYAVSPDARYTMDCIRLGARYGKHVSMSYQSLKWMHVGTDVLNRPLYDTVREFGDYCLAQNEHIGPQHFTRQTSVWAFWLTGVVRHWGIEPQSWWFENGRMLRPGLFGQDADNTRLMPPMLYRAMILEGVKMGATVFQFEPFWDLYDYDNGRCWRDVIAPTLVEVIERRLIPTREQVQEKIKVAYHLREASNINEFHENLRDVDFIHDEGLLARAAYGLWARFLEHELVPMKGRHYYIPLLPPPTDPAHLSKYAHVIRPAECASVADYEKLLAPYYPGDGEGTASIMRVGRATYVMHSHANLYERQTYAIDLPQPVRGLQARREGGGVKLAWPADPGASAYQVYRRPAGAGWPRPGEWLTPVLGTTVKPEFLDPAPPAGGAVYTVTALTRTQARREGTVNFLDFLVFDRHESVPAEEAVVRPGIAPSVRAIAAPPDDRPASQVVWPTFDGAGEQHLPAAREIVARFEAMKTVYEAMDWRRMTEFYSADYEDPNRFHREYVGRAWKWWFFRNNSTCLLMQIRSWDFADYAAKGLVRVKLFSLFRALRRDDGIFGYHWDGTLRIPRKLDEEVVYTWRRDPDGVWRLVHTDPAVPNFEEILWNSRGSDKTGAKLQPGVDD
jgi:hypothetical protein